MELGGRGIGSPGDVGGLGSSGGGGAVELGGSGEVGYPGCCGGAFVASSAMTLLFGPTDGNLF